VFAKDFDANTKSNSVDGRFRADSVRRASAQSDVVSLIGPISVDRLTTFESRETDKPRGAVAAEDGHTGSREPRAGRAGNGGPL
jgi:hypothetical protein